MPWDQLTHAELAALAAEAQHQQEQSAFRPPAQATRRRDARAAALGYEARRRLAAG